MNKTEGKFANILWGMMHAGEILDYSFEPIKFRLAQKTGYTIDFRVTLPNFQNIYIEVKASKKDGSILWRDDAAVKCKTVPEMHPYPFFLAVCGEDGWTVTRLPSRKWGHIPADVKWMI